MYNLWRNVWVLHLEKQKRPSYMILDTNIILTENVVITWRENNNNLSWIIKRKGNRDDSWIKSDDAELSCQKLGVQTSLEPINEPPDPEDMSSSGPGGLIWLDLNHTQTGKFWRDRYLDIALNGDVYSSILIAEWAAEAERLLRLTSCCFSAGHLKENTP